MKISKEQHSNTIPAHVDKHIPCYIGLGSNLNQPIKQLKTAIASLQQLPHSRFIHVSSFYQTTPLSSIHQEDFINAVAYLETQLSPHNLLLALQKIEHAQGRVRTEEKNGPRVLDLDLLIYGNQMHTESDLIIPHPRLKERAFVLIPLLEIAPELVLANGDAAKDYLVALGNIEKLVRWLG